MAPSFDNTFLLKRLLMFCLLFLGLSLVSNLEVIQKSHDTYFNTLITPIHNFINPNVHAVFAKEQRTDLRHFGVGITLYNKKLYGSQLKRQKFRESVGPYLIKFPNLHPLVLLPSLLLISLIIITPIKWKAKLKKSVIGIALLYLILILFFAYSFELTLSDGNFKIDSFWTLLVALFGFDNQELINVCVFFIWIGLVGPSMIKKYKPAAIQLTTKAGTATG